jgi:hypothetical protein
MKIVKDNIRSNPGPAAALLTKMKANMDSLATKAIHSGTTAKYTSINTKDGYVEFRSPGGDWLGDNFDLIEPTLLRFVVALDAAIDPEKYRQEYQKKLYKLLTTKSESADTNELSRILSMYLSGQADQKTAARDLAQQATTRKKNKKDPGSLKEPAASAALLRAQQQQWLHWQHAQPSSVPARGQQPALCPAQPQCQWHSWPPCV